MEKVRKFPKIPETLPHASVYGFGPYQLDLRKRLVLREGEPIPFSPKDFELLLALVEHAGQVLVKEELMQRVWPDTAVEEGNLNRHISTLRKTLGESPEEHEYIVTVPGRGYRFVAKVRELSAENGQQAQQAAAQPLGHGVRLVDTDCSTGNEAPAGRSGLVTAVAPIQAEDVRSTSRSVWIWGSCITVIAALAVAGLWLVRSRPKPILTEADHILVADFANSTSDPVFDDALKQGLAVQLEQSPAINILSDARVQSALRLMTKPPSTRLTPEIARDVCKREGARAYVSGAISSLGSQFVLSVSAVDCASGDILAREQATAADKEHVLNALDQAATSVRRRLGESRATLQRFAIPLIQATTPSMEALQAFSQGNEVLDRKGDAAAIPFYQHAVALDAKFALAYDAIGVAYSNLDEPGLASENISKAFELRERASERERFQIDANYSQIVNGDLERANQICELWSRTYPGDVYPHNLLGVNYEFLGQYEKALAEMNEALRLNPDGVILRSNLMEDEIALGRLAEGKAAYNLAMERKLDHPFLHADRYAIAFLEGDGAEMERQVAMSAGQPGGEDLLISLASDTSAFSGNLHKARELSRRAVDAALHGGQKETAALWQMNAALREAELGNAGEAKIQAAKGLEISSTRDVQVLAALVLARAGDSTRAEALAGELAKRFPQNKVIQSYWLPSVRAAVDLNRNNPSNAVEELRPAAPYEFGYPDPEVEVSCFLYPAYLRGLAYLQLKKWPEAEAEFRKFGEHRGIVVNSPLAPLSQLGLARAYRSAGDVEKARATYQTLLGTWQHADADIPVVRQAKQEFSSLR